MVKNYVKRSFSSIHANMMSQTDTKGHPRGESQICYFRNKQRLLFPASKVVLACFYARRHFCIFVSVFPFFFPFVSIFVSCGGDFSTDIFLVIVIIMHLCPDFISFGLTFFSIC